MTTPKFTVVIPTCRRNDLLARCLDKLAPDAQTLPAAEYEIIVSDDGSPDANARALVESRYPGVRWLQGPRRGPAANRNFGASHATAPWLVFTDDDCMPQPEWLAAFFSHVAIGVNGGCRVLEGRTECGVERIGPFEQAPGNDKGGLLWSCNFAIERALFERMGGFDAGFPYPHLEDVDFRLRLDDAKEPYRFVPEARILHPPRPVGSALNWTRTQESSFYLARKRGVPLAAVNFSLGSFLRMYKRSLHGARGAGEFARLGWRIAEEVALLCVYLPRFAWKYRRRTQTSGSPN